MRGLRKVLGEIPVLAWEQRLLVAACGGGGKEEKEEKKKLRGWKTGGVG